MTISLQPIQVSQNNINSTNSTDSTNSTLWCLDANYIGTERTASYLLSTENELILFDCGTNFSIPLLLQQIAQLNLNIEHLSTLVLTHAHLDHAGGAGLLLEQFPDLQVYAHPSALKHLINPENLQRGVIQTYGKSFFEQYYQQIIPLNPNNTHPLEDGQTLHTKDGVAIQCLYTPGHAWNHIAYWFLEHRCLFSGDAFGISFKPYHTEDKIFITPVTPPSQFDLDASIASIEKIIQLNPSKVMLSHYGAIDYSIDYSIILKQLLYDYSDLAKQLSNEDLTATQRQQRWLTLFQQALKQQGFNETIDSLTQHFDSEITLCRLGLEHWLAKSK